jgi:hypothetical protein
MAFDLLAGLRFDHQWPPPPAHYKNAAAAAKMILSMQLQLGEEVIIYIHCS